MGKRIKLLSIRKFPYRSEYCFPKDQVLIDILREFLNKMGFESYEFDDLGYAVDKDDKPVKGKLNIKVINNEIKNYLNEDYSVDIIFFLEKVYLIINSREDKQQEISKILEDFIED